MTSFKLFLIYLVNCVVIYAEISDQRLCANSDCSEPISRAKTILRYSSDDSRILSFPANADVTIYSKSAGKRLDLWGAEINGKRGYVPTLHIRETTVLKSKYDYLRATEGHEQLESKVVTTEKTESAEHKVLESTILPNSVAQPHEVIDGTTIYLADDLSNSYTTQNIISETTSDLKQGTQKQIIEPVNLAPTEHLKQEPPKQVVESVDKVPTEEKKEQTIEEIKQSETVGTSAEEDGIFGKISKLFESDSAEADDEMDDEEDDEDDEEAEEDSEENVGNETSINPANSGSKFDSAAKNFETNQIGSNYKNDLNSSVSTASNDKSNIPHDVPSDLPNSQNLQKPELVSTETKVPSSSENIRSSENFAQESPEVVTEFNTVTEQSILEIPLPLEPEEFTVTNAPDVKKVVPFEEKSEDIIDSNSHKKVQHFQTFHKVEETNVSVASEHEKIEQPETTQVQEDFVFEETISGNVSIAELGFTHAKPQQPEISHAQKDLLLEETINNVSSAHSEIASTPLVDKPFEEKNAEVINSNLHDAPEGIQQPQTSADEIIPAQNNSDEEGFFSKVYSSIFETSSQEVVPQVSGNEEASEEPDVIESVKTPGEPTWDTHTHESPVDKYLPGFVEKDISGNVDPNINTCNSNENPSGCFADIENDEESVNEITNNRDLSSTVDLPEYYIYSIFAYLSLTAVTVLFFSLGHYYIEKKGKYTKLLASINGLEKKLLISTKECLLLHDELEEKRGRLRSIEDSSFGSNEMVTSLKNELEEAQITRFDLEEQILGLEKELENATEAGMELNRMLQDVLSSQPGNEHLIQNVEHLQKQLREQQTTINNMNSVINAKGTENELLQTELTVANEKVVQLQVELDKVVVNLLSVQEEKSKLETDFDEEQLKMKSQFQLIIKNLQSDLNASNKENSAVKKSFEDTQDALELKTNEYTLLKEGMRDMQVMQNNKESLKALLDVSAIKAEVQQLRDEKRKLYDKIQNETEVKSIFEKQVEVMLQEVNNLKEKFDEAEREKVEAQTRLEVLSTYFKQREVELQKEINDNESKWLQKEGEATSTVERIKWIQEELLNYKSQNDLLKKEILDQEVSLKSQISMLEKKSHDNWVLARQAERRLEETKQEAGQLRNRLTIVEKNLNNASQITDESKLQNRIMSPMESNGDLAMSPLHMGNIENPGSPPLLFPTRDHLTTSPPLPGMPFMPPPPGVPFMPPPIPGVPPFMPPPPALFPGDHRPPPLGRMSSPPLHSRYSPDSSYDQDDSPPLSPSYNDSDYRRRSPPPPRSYNPYGGKGRTSHWDDDREYRNQSYRSKPQNHKGQGLSSGSGNSNDSLDNSGRHSNRI